jgi:hypothetical protein
LDSQINFTFDAGTSRSSDPFFTITVSFIEEFTKTHNQAKCWQLVSGPIAFIKIEGAHNAETFSEIMYNVFMEYDILSKVFERLFTKFIYLIILR